MKTHCIKLISPSSTESPQSRTTLAEAILKLILHSRLIRKMRCPRSGSEEQVLSAFQWRWWAMERVHFWWYLKINTFKAVQTQNYCLTTNRNTESWLRASVRHRADAHCPRWICYCRSVMACNKLMLIRLEIYSNDSVGEFASKACLCCTL